MARHLTRAERIERGREARAELPRQRHAELAAPSARQPIALLQAQAATRLAELIPIRYGRMQRSPLAFYRGAAAVMTADLAAGPRTSLRVQLCGDAHLLNFGGFASPERDLVFDVNDFDETLPGPFEWDVKRLVASIPIAARELELTEASGRAAALETARGYRETMRQLAALGDLDTWYSRADAASLQAQLQAEGEHEGVKEMTQVNARARATDTLHELDKLTQLVDGEPRIVASPPLIVPLADLTDRAADLESSLRRVFRSYLRSLQRDRRQLLESFRYGDLARKVVGIGSVGTGCWVLLLIGTSEQDALFLQIKEAQPSVLEPSLGAGANANQGRRVVEGQRLSQAVSDIFLGWTGSSELDGTPRDFYVRQLRDWKVSVDLERLRARGLAIYGRWCGEALARAHARSGDRIAIAAYLGKSDVFDRALATFASAYAELNERDHASLLGAVADGTLAATDAP